MTVRPFNHEGHEGSRRKAKGTAANLDARILLVLPSLTFVSFVVNAQSDPGFADNPRNKSANAGVHAEFAQLLLPRSPFRSRLSVQEGVSHAIENCRPQNERRNYCRRLRGTHYLR